jgi:hypothetical protein
MIRHFNIVNDHLSILIGQRVRMPARGLKYGVPADPFSGLD